MKCIEDVELASANLGKPFRGYDCTLDAYLFVDFIFECPQSGGH